MSDYGTWGNLQALGPIGSPSDEMKVWLNEYKINKWMVCEMYTQKNTRLLKQLSN